ncbi:hypothetical protein MPER_05549 [Moniliophthora perniciosa FA553]|nr:hypothetical protein MPER_05549 [Moniliophthora perniciosa FA553]
MSKTEEVTSIMPIDQGMVSAIRSSIQDNADRGLKVASKWSAELLMSIANAKRASFRQKEELHGILLGAEGDRALELDEADEIDTARRCMDSRQYLRAEHYARECRSAKGIFIYVYSRFLVRDYLLFPIACAQP